MILMAPTINNFDILNVTNSTENKFVAMMKFTSNPTCGGGGACNTSFYNYLPGLLLMVSLYLVLFLSLKLRGFSFSGCFLACNVFNFILALIFFTFEIISGQILVVSIILLPLSGLIIWLENR